MFLSKKIKDIQIRKQYKQKEYFLKLNKSIQTQLYSYSYKYNKILFTKLNYINISKKKTSSLKTKIVRRCNETNRNRSVFRKFGLSRLTLKNYFSFGLLPGYKKAVW
jgi:small subunit ribosomal protein S14